MNSEALLEIDNLGISHFSENTQSEILSSVSFTIHENHCLGLVGESGSGKTLTCMAILNLLPANIKKKYGHIFFDGKDILKYSERKMQNIRGKSIAMVTQDPMTCLFPLHKIGKQFYDLLSYHKGFDYNKSMKIALDYCDKLQLSDQHKILSAYPYELSGGMRQRVAIALALSCEPKLLIADEPTTALDAIVQAEILSLLKEIKKQSNLSILLISHDLGVISDVCDEIHIMYQGRIIEKSKIDLFFDEPKHPYSQELLYSLPVFKDNRKRLTLSLKEDNESDRIQEGCHYINRCSYATASCKVSQPELFEIDKKQHVACWSYHKK